jgi:HSP20 family protein
MTQLPHWIPERWRDALANLRDELYDIAERWWPGRQDQATSQQGNVPVRYTGRTELVDTFAPSSQFAAGSPVIDLDETDNELLVTAELPGLDPDDFVVELTRERLVIRGEKKHESSHEGRGYRYSERRYGAFARALRLPCEVDTDHVHANYKHGILRVTLPKTMRAKAKRVTIQAQN